MSAPRSPEAFGAGSYIPEIKKTLLPPSFYGLEGETYLAPKEARVLQGRALLKKEPDLDLWQQLFPSFIGDVGGEPTVCLSIPDGFRNFTGKRATKAIRAYYNHCVDSYVVNGQLSSLDAARLTGRPKGEFDDLAPQSSPRRRTPISGKYDGKPPGVSGWKKALMAVSAIASTTARPVIAEATYRFKQHQETRAEQNKLVDYTRSVTVARAYTGPLGGFQDNLEVENCTPYFTPQSIPSLPFPATMPDAEQREASRPPDLLKPPPIPMTEGSFRYAEVSKQQELADLIKELGLPERSINAFTLDGISRTSDLFTVSNRVVLIPSMDGKGTYYVVIPQSGADGSLLVAVFQTNGKGYVDASSTQFQTQLEEWIKSRTEYELQKKANHERQTNLEATSAPHESVVRVYEWTNEIPFDDMVRKIGYIATMREAGDQFPGWDIVSVQDQEGQVRLVYYKVVLLNSQTPKVVIADYTQANLNRLLAIEEELLSGREDTYSPEGAHMLLCATPSVQPSSAVRRIVLEKGDTQAVSEGLTSVGEKDNLESVTKELMLYGLARGNNALYVLLNDGVVISGNTWKPGTELMRIRSGDAGTSFISYSSDSSSLPPGILGAMILRGIEQKDNILKPGDIRYEGVLQKDDATNFEDAFRKLYPQMVDITGQLSFSYGENEIIIDFTKGIRVFADKNGSLVFAVALDANGEPIMHGDSDIGSVALYRMRSTVEANQFRSLYVFLRYSLKMDHASALTLALEAGIPESLRPEMRWMVPPNATLAEYGVIGDPGVISEQIAGQGYAEILWLKQSRKASMLLEQDGQRVTREQGEALGEGFWKYTLQMNPRNGTIDISTLPQALTEVVSAFVTLSPEGQLVITTRSPHIRSDKEQERPKPMVINAMKLFEPASSLSDTESMVFQIGPGLGVGEILSYYNVSSGDNEKIAHEIALRGYAFVTRPGDIEDRDLMYLMVKIASTANPDSNAGSIYGDVALQKGVVIAGDTLLMIALSDKPQLQMLLTDIKRQLACTTEIDRVYYDAFIDGLARQQIRVAGGGPAEPPHYRMPLGAVLLTGDPGNIEKETESMMQQLDNSYAILSPDGHIYFTGTDNEKIRHLMMSTLQRWNNGEDARLVVFGKGGETEPRVMRKLVTGLTHRRSGGIAFLDPTIAGIYDLRRGADYYKTWGITAEEYLRFHPEELSVSDPHDLEQGIFLESLNPVSVMDGFSHADRSEKDAQNFMANYGLDTMSKEKAQQFIEFYMTKGNPGETAWIEVPYRQGYNLKQAFVFKRYYDDNSARLFLVIPQHNFWSTSEINEKLSTVVAQFDGAQGKGFWGDNLFRDDLYSDPQKGLHTVSILELQPLAVTGSDTGHEQAMERIANGGSELSSVQRNELNVNGIVQLLNGDYIVRKSNIWEDRGNWYVIKAGSDVERAILKLGYMNMYLYDNLVRTLEEQQVRGVMLQEGFANDEFGSERDALGWISMQHSSMKEIDVLDIPDGSQKHLFYGVNESGDNFTGYVLIATIRKMPDGTYKVDVRTSRGMLDVSGKLLKDWDVFVREWGDSR